MLHCTPYDDDPENNNTLNKNVIPKIPISHCQPMQSACSNRSNNSHLPSSAHNNVYILK